MSWVQKWLSRMLISIPPNLVSCHGFSVSLNFSNECAAISILQLIRSHVNETRSSCPNALILFMNSLGRWWREWITFFSSCDVWTCESNSYQTDSCHFLKHFGMEQVIFSIIVSWLQNQLGAPVLIRAFQQYQLESKGCNGLQDLNMMNKTNKWCVTLWPCHLH
jgi:hypothetical protein